MKKTDDQIDFNFSRPLDIQKNLDVDFLDVVLNEIDFEKNNQISYKHLKFLVLELFYCWLESSNQLLATSMSKKEVTYQFQDTIPIKYHHIQLRL